MKIYNLRNECANEWQWTVKFDDGSKSDYWTDETGEGLWRDGKQIAGFCQFSISSARTRRAIYAKIYRYLNQ